MRRTLVLITTCLIATSCGGPESELTDDDLVGFAQQEVREVRGDGYSLRVAASKVRKGRFARSFAIDELDSLHFALDVPPLEGRHVAQLVVYSDGDVPFVRYDFAYVVREPAKEGESKAVRAERNSDAHRVWIAMPVAGTWIQQFRLTGNWRAEVTIDHGEVGPLTAEFELR